MKNRIECADLANMGATLEQLNTYSNTDPLNIYQIDGNLYKITGVIEAETDAQGVLDYLDSLSEPDC